MVEVYAQLLVSVEVMAADGNFLDGYAHAIDQAVGLRVSGFPLAMSDVAEYTGVDKQYET